MFREKDLRGFSIRATDGVIGEVEDLYFDDEDWVIRYLVVDTSSWLHVSKVLISPLAIGQPDWIGRCLPAALTKAQIEKSPDIDTNKPVSRQQEAAYFQYYAYPNYWGGGGLWGMGAYPGSLTMQDGIEEKMKAQQAPPVQSSDDCHLRSCRAVIGNHVHAKDGDIGHVEDVLVDDHTWAIPYLIVDTRNWWVGHYVLVAPQRIESVSWLDAEVSVDLTRQAIRNAPAYDSAAQLDRQRVPGVYQHHGSSDEWNMKAREAVATSSK